MKDSEHLHIAIASDEYYARFVAVVIASVLDNNKSFDRITFHLLANGIASDTLDNIRLSLDNSKSGLVVHDISDLPERLGIEVPPTIALTSYARLFMAEIIDRDISEIFYLDTDIVVNGNLKDLWAVDLGQNYAGGCLDVFEGSSAKTDVGLKPSDPYVNAGVLLINLDEWRRCNMSGKFIDFLHQHNGNVHHHDQGIINGVCKGRIKVIPPEYNMHSTVFSHPYSLITKITTPYYDEESYRNAIKHPVIIHFTEGFYNRPWKKNCKHPYKDAYMKYSSVTAWKDYPLMPDNRSVAVKLLSYSFFKFPYLVYRCVSSIIGSLQRLKNDKK